MAKVPHLLVHDRRDNVGVVVVENLASGTDMFCVVTWVQVFPASVVRYIP